MRKATWIIALPDCFITHIPSIGCEVFYIGQLSEEKKAKDGFVEVSIEWVHIHYLFTKRFTKKQILFLYSPSDPSQARPLREEEFWDAIR